MHRLNGIKYRILTTGNLADKLAFLSGLENLWMETFGDSKAYVELVYSTYLKPSIIITCEDENGQLISALLAIPYPFIFSSDKQQTTGWYLCGLSTIKEFRGMGIMEKMMRMAEEEVRNIGGGFMFLIPADTRLETYYSRKGYVAGALRAKILIVEDSCLPEAIEGITYNNKEKSKDDLKIDSDCEVRRTSWSKLTDKKRGDLISFLIRHEETDNASSDDILSIKHSQADYETILRENEISGGDLIILEKKDSDTDCKESQKNRILSIAICYSHETDDGTKTIEIRKIAGPVSESVKLLKILSRGSKIDLFISSINKVMIDEIVKSFESNNDDLGQNCELTEMNERYIMVKSLYDEIEESAQDSGQKTPESRESEISIFVTNKSSNLKYPIFRNGAKNVSKRNFEASPENLVSRALDEEDHSAKNDSRTNVRTIRASNISADLLLD